MVQQNLAPNYFGSETKFAYKRNFWSKNNVVKNFGSEINFWNEINFRSKTHYGARKILGNELKFDTDTHCCGWKQILGLKKFSRKKSC